MDTLGQLNPTADEDQIFYVIVDHFSNYVVTLPALENIVQYAVNAFFQHWNSNVVSLQKLIAAKKTEFSISETANCCILFDTRRSCRASHSPWTKGLVEVQHKNFGTHLRLFLHDTTENWSMQVHFFANAHNFQPLSHVLFSPYEVV